MPESSVAVLLVIGLGLVFGYLNGFHDSANIVATMIASRALSGRQALAITAIAESVGPFVFGVAVATTTGNEVLDVKAIGVSVTLAALVAAVLWNLLTWWLGIPSSSSHALIGGLIIVTAVTLALSHGTNDAQKTMGVITMGLVAAGVLPTFQVPLWVIAISAGAIALGTWTGGWRLIKTLGGKFYKIRPIHGFTAQTSSAAVILSAAMLGGPVSTTQVVSSAIMGVGSAERVSKVRWGVAQQIVIAWVTTIPTGALAAALVEMILLRWSL